MVSDYLKKKKVVIFPLEHSSWGLTLGSSNSDTAYPVSWVFTERNLSPEWGSAAVNSPPSGDRGGHPRCFAPAASQAQCSPGLENPKRRCTVHDPLRRGSLAVLDDCFVPFGRSGWQAGKQCSLDPFFSFPVFISVVIFFVPRGRTS